MSQMAAQASGAEVSFGAWGFDEIDMMERKRQALRNERREIDRERRKLEREKREFCIARDSEDRRMEQERRLFDMKWKLLEEEMKKLADEKRQVEKQRRFYQFVNDHETKAIEKGSAAAGRGDLFFVGVQNKQALKKRYKDLLKIYHPDNVSGDVGTVQEINREYDRLQAQYS